MQLAAGADGGASARSPHRRHRITGRDVQQKEATTSTPNRSQRHQQPASDERITAV